ncbi:MAG TPA: hypothetical protein VMI56_06790 [Reyranella sp.]|nr:hypothetical protein [Reyranella sp.]
MAGAFGFVIFGGALWLIHAQQLPARSPVLAYVLYLAMLVVLGVLAAPFPRLAMVVLSLLALETGLGFGSALLLDLGMVDTSLLPSRYFERTRFKWHPLLQAVPIPSAAAPGDEVVVNINSAGLRGRERSADELRRRVVVAVFGGSTTYDAAVGDGDTWPERLETLLGADRYAVLNHGVPAYTTEENVIQTAFYAEAYGVRPRCAVYYVGWNDLHTAHVRGLDPGYADFHAPGQAEVMGARRLDSPYLAISPTFSLLARLVSLAADTVQLPEPEGARSAAPDPALEAIYARNIEAISAINRQRGIVTIWIGQVLNREVLARNVSDPWMPFVEDKDLWAMVERLNTIARGEAARLRDAYIDVPVDRFSSSDFVDRGHFNPGGSAKFASLVAPGLSAACH